MYSNSAMPQLTRIARYSGLLCRFFRCAYHAKVMKQLDTIRSRVVLTMTGMELERECDERLRLRG